MESLVGQNVFVTIDTNCEQCKVRFFSLQLFYKIQGSTLAKASKHPAEDINATKRASEGKVLMSKGAQPPAIWCHTISLQVNKLI